MLMSQTRDRLHEMRLLGMAEGLSNQLEQPDVHNLSFEERFSLLVDQEWTYRRDRRQARLLKAAKLRMEASVEDIDYHHPRGLDRSAMATLASCQWIRNQQVLLITGATGTGKTFLACALGHQACRHGLSTRYYRVPRLMSELTQARGDGSLPRLLSRLSRISLLILDDWGLAPLSQVEARDLLEIIDDRDGIRSTLMASQLPVGDWHQIVADPTVADALMDRLIHRAHRIELRGDSMRKRANNSTKST